MPKRNSSACLLSQELELNEALGGEYSDMDSAEQAVLLFKGLASMQHFTKLKCVPGDRHAYACGLQTACV